MKMDRTYTPDIPEARYVEVITSRNDGRVNGYRFSGSRPGPTVLVAGFNPIAAHVYDRLLSLPTLPWLRGTLSLIMLDTLDATDGLEAEAFASNDSIDEVLFLPATASESTDLTAVLDGYWTVLRLCGRLGMIDGRGVFRKTLVL